jgi:hypothetical protein
VTCVIAEPFLGENDLSCVEVCPVDCIHPTKEEQGFDDEPQLSAECIDCDASVEARSIDACFAGTSFPASGLPTSRSTPSTTDGGPRRSAPASAALPATARDRHSRV